MLDDWLVPHWPAPANVRAVCTTRTGGTSEAPYDSLNLGDHVGDDPAHVVANRIIFQQAIDAQPVFLNQVHGTRVLQLNTSTPYVSQADACITGENGVACTIMVADCLPLLFTTIEGQWVAAAHAGWRGLAGHGGIGVVEQTHKDLCALAQVDRAGVAAQIAVWMGPCIGPTAFEVGSEVRAAFLAYDTQAAHLFKPLLGDKWLADLAGLARRRLVAQGITQIYGNDSSAAWCTVSNAARFFSHRRDRVSGRFAVSIWKE